MSKLLGQAIAALALTLAAMALVGVAVGFFAAALYLALAAEVSPRMAALICGGVFVFLALVLLLIARGVLGRRKTAPHPAANGAPASPEVAAELGQAIGETARVALRGKTPHMVAAALGAGFAIGVSPRLRRTILRFLQ